MSTIRQSEWIEFNGVTSDTLNILNVNMSSGMQNENLWGSRSLIQTKVPGKDKTYLHKVITENYKFTLQLAYEDTFDGDSLREVFRWLRTDTFAPMRFSARPDIVYFCILVDQPTLYHTTANQGYIEANFECDSNYMYSDVISEQFDLSDNGASGTVIQFYNRGDLDIYMDFDITKIDSDGDVTITSLTNGGEFIKFTSLVEDENLIFYGDNEIIESTETGSRFSTWNEVNPTMVVGLNRFKVEGKCQLKISYQYKMLAG